MKKETIRKLGIALAAILGPGALLYLSGLVAQLQINYEDWLHIPIEAQVGHRGNAAALDRMCRNRKKHHQNKRHAKETLFH